MLFKSFKRRYDNFSRVLAASDLETTYRIYGALSLVRDPVARRFSVIRANMDYLEKKFSYLIERYQDAPHVQEANQGPIWVFWWQGEEAMPPIVRKCYEQLLKMAPANHPVQLVTKDNLAGFISLPEHILSLLHSGHITLTHFSDICRATLLSEHGGMWFDSTVYVASPIQENLFETPYFSGKAPYNSKFVNRCMYTGFMIGGAKRAPWFCFLRDFLFDYWKTRGALLDYLLIDYALTMALDHLPTIREDVSRGIVHTDYIHTLEAIRNEPYDEAKYKEMVSSCPFFKMSYKLPNVEHTPKGKLTYYGYLLQS